jgi:excisionase family DNA binding protein
MAPKATTESEETLYSIQRTAYYLGTSQDTVRRMIAEGRLPAFRVGAHLIRIKAADVEALLRPIPTVAAGR